MALIERPCARNPATPNPAAKIAAVVRCSETEPSVACGSDARQRAARQHQHVRIGANRPFDKHDRPRTRRRRRPRRWPPAHAMRRAARRPPESRTRSWRHRRGSCRARSWWRRTDRPRANRTRSARSGLRSAGGPNRNPHTTSSAARINPAMTWNSVRADHRRSALQAGEGPQQREHDGGDREPAPQPDARQPERRRGDDGEIDVQRPVVRLVRRNQDRGDKGGGDAEAGQRRPVQQAAASVPSATSPSRMNAVAGTRKPYSA